MNLRNCTYEDEDLMWELGYIRFMDYDIVCDDMEDRVKMKDACGTYTRQVFVDESNIPNIYVEMDSLINGWFVDTSFCEHKYLMGFIVDDEEESEDYPDGIVRIYKRQFIRLLPKGKECIKGYDVEHHVTAPVYEDVVSKLEESDIDYLSHHDMIKSLLANDNKTIYEVRLNNNYDKDYLIVKCKDRYYVQDPLYEAYERDYYFAPERDDVILWCYKCRFRRLDLI